MPQQNHSSQLFNERGSRLSLSKRPAFYSRSAFEPAARFSMFSYGLPFDIPCSNVFGVAATVAALEVDFSSPELSLIFGAHRALRLNHDMLSKVECGVAFGVFRSGRIVALRFWFGTHGALVEDVTSLHELFEISSCIPSVSTGFRIH